MMSAIRQPALEAGLPQLRGRLALAYRALWVTLALGAAVALAASTYQSPAEHPAVLLLRLAKGGVVIAVCTILLRRRRDDPVAALLSLAFLTWTITSSFDFASADQLPLLLDRVRFLFFVLALLLFPDGRWQPSWARTVACVSFAVFLLGVVETLGLLSTHLFLPLAIACVLAAVAALILRFRTAESQVSRQQLKWIALGLVVGISLVLTARAGVAVSRVSAVVPPMPILWEALFQLGIVAIALGFLVSLLRYRLFDAETAISRSAALAGLTVALVATFAGTEATIEWVGQQYLGMGIGDISAAMAAAVAAVLLNPFHHRISEWAEGRFQRDLVRLRKELPELLADLAASASPRELGEAILPCINESVHAVRSALVADGNVIASCGIDIDTANLPFDESQGQFPVRLSLRSQSSDRSWLLLLGPRPDGSTYGKEDLEALGAVGAPLRTALSWALYREEVRTTAERHLELTRRDIALLNQRIESLSAREAQCPQWVESRH
jgi:hypothetical protein